MKQGAITLMRYATDLVHYIYLEGAGLSQLAGDLGRLAFIALVSTSPATWMFRQRIA